VSVAGSNAHLGPACRDVDVAIVGAGFAGLGMGIQLALRGRESFVVLERAEEVGGTWRDNRYPGVACDVPSHLYSFSFRPKADWSTVFASGAEIQAYLRQCASEERLRSRIRCSAEVRHAQWDAHDGRWRVTTGVGTYRARTLIMAAGRLSEARIPDVGGLSGFPGPVFHSSHWDDDVTLSGRRVGIVGTGASAAQIVPQLAGTAGRLVVFQRSAPYVVPRGDRSYTEDERQRFERDPEAARRLRDRLFWEAEQAIAQRKGVRPDIDLLRERALGHLAAQVPDPELRARLTPDYEIGCKRVLLSDEFYPALDRDDVTLESSALDRVEGDTAIAASGARYRLDVIVLATGFLSTRPPFAQRIVGRDGVLLAARWAKGMVAHASTAVYGFPNMFVLDGPNASLGHNSAIHMIETQIGYVLGALDYLATAPDAVLEVTAAAEQAYTRDIDAMSRSTVWIRGGCNSWYVDDRSGRLTLLWPDSAQSFRERNGVFDPRPYRLDPARTRGRHSMTPLTCRVGVEPETGG
jgi:cation diffusion facilitator CzcD-associated flavoprotein CzcO